MTEAARNVIFRSSSTGYNSAPSSALSQGSPEQVSSNQTEAHPNTIINKTLQNNMSSAPEIDTERKGNVKQENENNRNEQNSPLSSINEKDNNIVKASQYMENNNQSSVYSYNSNNHENDNLSTDNNKVSNSSSVHTSFQSDENNTTSRMLSGAGSTLSSGKLETSSRDIDYSPLTPCNTMNSLVDMDASNSGSVGEENKNNDGGLPRPTQAPEQVQVYMKGKYKSEDGFHKCKGFWAYSLDAHSMEQEEATQKGLISKFQFELDSGTQGPANGRYEGYWMLYITKSKDRVRQTDKNLDIKFEPNSNTPYGYNVTGKGEVEPWGHFVISGTYDKSTDDILLYRNYLTNENTVKKKVGRTGPRGPRLAKTISSLISSSGQQGLVEPERAPSLLERAETSTNTRVSRPRKAPSVLLQTELDKQMQKCLDILKFLLSQGKKANPFKQPVDTSFYTNYRDFVQEPMDLGTIKTMIETRELNDRDEFARLVRLVFQNAMTYTPQDTEEVHQSAKMLLDAFDAKYEQARNFYDPRAGKRGPFGGSGKKSSSRLGNDYDDEDDDMEIDDDEDEEDNFVRGKSIHNMDRFSDAMSNTSRSKRGGADRKSVASGESNSKRSGRGGRGGGRGGGGRGGGRGRSSKLVRTSSFKSSQRGSERGSQNGDGRRGGRGRGRGQNNSTSNYNDMVANMINNPAANMINPFGMGMWSPFGMPPWAAMVGNAGLDPEEMITQQIEQLQAIKKMTGGQGGGAVSSPPTERGGRGGGRGRGGGPKARANKNNNSMNNDEDESFPAPIPISNIHSSSNNNLADLQRPLSKDEEANLLDDLQNKLETEDDIAEALQIVGKEAGEHFEVSELSAPEARTLMKLFDKIRKRK